MFHTPRRLLSGLALLSCLICGCLPLFAQSGTDPVAVRRVDFNQVGRGQESWIEMAVTLNGGPGADPAATNPDFNNLVTVRVSLGFQHGRSGEPAFTFYRAQATLVSLERNRDATVSFYLPPEIVRRDRLQREPYAWMIELEVGGQALPGRREHVSRSLNSAEVIASFRARVEADAPQTEGQLLPVYLTPFYGRGSEMPSFVRRSTAP